MIGLPLTIGVRYFFNAYTNQK